MLVYNGYYFLTPGLIMPRRTCEPWYYHVYNRWFEKMIIFKSEIDFERFYKLLIKYSNDEKYRYIKILSYSFLPNHFHFVISNPGVELSNFMWVLQNAYSKYFNIKYDRRWQLFEGRFKAKLINNQDYLYKCIHYVNFNPLKHKIVSNIKDYKYTSYHQLTKKEKDENRFDLILDELEF